mgnify:FL=1
MWKRLAPSRTKKLSTSWVMILRLTGRGKVARCGLCFFLFLKSQIDYIEGLNLMFDLHNCTSIKLEQATPKVFFRVISGFVLNKNMQIKDIL